MKTFLIVDDHDDLRQSLKSLLEAMGHLTVSVGNGKEALDYLKTGETPQVILLDLTMPVMNGWDFRRLQLQDPNYARIPTIVMSGTERDQAGEELSVDDYILKPIEPTALLAMIEKYQ